MHAVILERHKLVGRKVARLFLGVGARVTLLEEPQQVAAALADANADVVCADAFDGDLIVEQLRAHPGVRGVLWTAEPLRRSLKFMMDAAAIHHVLGRRDFESPPRTWEMLMVARRLATSTPTSTITDPPPLGAYLDWGFTSEQLTVRSTADRDSAVAQIAEFVARLQVPKRIGEMFGELGHELIMNAIYDAPVDAAGHRRYAGDRKAAIELAAPEQPTVRLATDGTRLVLQVRDPFGRLARRDVVDGLARGLAGGEMDQRGGGAGLGMMVCHNASSAMFFDVARGRHTEVTAMFELDMNLREFRTQAKSLHISEHA